MCKTGTVLGNKLVTARACDGILRDSDGGAAGVPWLDGGTSRRLSPPSECGGCTAEADRCVQCTHPPAVTANCWASAVSWHRINFEQRNAQ